MSDTVIIARLLATYPAGYVCWLLLRMRAAASPPFIRLPQQLPQRENLLMMHKNTELKVVLKFEWGLRQSTNAATRSAASTRVVCSQYVPNCGYVLCVKRRVSEPHGLWDAAAPAPGGGARACFASCGHVAFEMKDNFHSLSGAVLSMHSPVARFHLAAWQLLRIAMLASSLALALQCSVSI